MSVTVDLKRNYFILEGAAFSYVMYVDETGRLNNLYYGEKIARDDLTYYRRSRTGAYSAKDFGGTKSHDELMPEYALASMGDFRESAFLAEDERGNRLFDMRYKGYEILSDKPALRSAMPVARGGETLVITLSEIACGFEIKLYYTVYENENILTRRAELVNTTKGSVRLLRALSMTLDLPDSDYKLLKLWGTHENERNVEMTELHHGIQSMGSTRGSSSHEANPFVALLRKNAEEESGAVIGCALMYSGSHYESVYVDIASRARLSVGINPTDFCWKLEAGESFETPEAVLCYSKNGLGGMSRSFHDFFREYVINPRYVYAPRPVVFNSWEGMHFAFDKERLCSAIDDIKGTGIDTFVLDDGWFGQRNNDKCALGDWYVNTEKLEGGLEAIADYCHANALKFGLWIEPEMVNPDSDLFRAHPDWAVQAPDHTPYVSRTQCILDLSRREVLDYIKDVMYKVISESGADYIKWDYNRVMTENWSYGLPADRQHEVQHRVILGVYELAKYLTESFPHVFFEGCASGGGRFDGGMLAYFPQIWTSDDTDAHERTIIQHGTNICYPLSATSNHVSISPSQKVARITPWETRRDVAYNGAFGYEFDTKLIPAEDMAKIKADVEKYRTLSDLMLRGDLYRMQNTARDGVMCQIVVSKDKSLGYLTFYRTHCTFKGTPTFKVNGLADGKLYRIKELDLALHGSTLRNVGLVMPETEGDFVTYTLTFEEVK